MEYLSAGQSDETFVSKHIQMTLRIVKLLMIRSKRTDRCISWWLRGFCVEWGRRNRSWCTIRKRSVKWLWSKRGAWVVRCHCSLDWPILWNPSGSWLSCYDSRGLSSEKSSSNLSRCHEFEFTNWKEKRGGWLKERWSGVNRSRDRKEIFRATTKVFLTLVTCGAIAA